MEAIETATLSKSLVDRLAIFQILLGELAPRLPARARIIDLGCGHCLFLKAARELGHEATGIDVRMERVPPEARPFVRQQNALEADLEPYDLILCLGLFYHLDLDGQLALVEKFRGRPAIVDTHYGKRERSREASGRTFWGSVYREGNLPTSGVGHILSFWPTEPDLVAILGANHSVLKWLPEHYPGRSFYLLTPRP